MLMRSTVTDQPPPTAAPPSFEDTAASYGLSPSPPKIPRLSIVMGAGSGGNDGQLTRSPGSGQ